MDVPTVAPATSGPGEGVAQNTGVAAAPQAPATSSGSSTGTQQPQQPKPEESTIASAVAKLYNVSPGPSGQPALDISYKYVSQLQLVVTVFTNAQTGEEVAQFPPQELIGLAEFFDQIDGVTLDRKV
ncbi:MAG: hypothetical protein WA629_12055 [Candidatus Aquilonibacter sp.]